MNWSTLATALRKVGHNGMHAQLPGDGPLLSCETKAGKVYATRNDEQGEPVTWVAMGQKWVKDGSA